MRLAPDLLVPLLLLAAPPAAAQLPGLDVRLDADGHLRAATGRCPVAPSGLDDTNLSSVSRGVLQDLEVALGVPADALREVRRPRAGGLIGWTAEQHLDGVPVEGSRVDLLYLADGTLVLVRASGLVRAAVPPLPTGVPLVSPGTAATLARAAAPPVSSESVAWDPRAVVLPTEERGPRYAWRVLVGDVGPAGIGGTWTAFVDRESGEVLRLDSNACAGDVLGTVDGRGLVSKTQETGGPPVAVPMRNLWVDALDTSAIGLWTLGGCDDEHPAVSASGDVIVYTSACGAGRDVWAMGPEGDAPLALTSDPGDDHSPTVDASGATVVFVSDRTGTDQLFVVHSDGGGLAQVTFGPGAKRGPVLDASGTTVYFACDVDGDFDLYSVGVDGSDLVQLTDDDAWDGEVDVASGAGLLVFASERDGDREVWAMALDGSGLTQLTFDDGYDGHPRVDDAGEVVVFESTVGLGDAGSGVPIGGALGRGGAFTRERGPRTSVWEIGTDGDGLRLLSQDGRASRHPAISGDGRLVAYAVREADGAERILLANRATGSVLPLSDGSVPVDEPVLDEDGDVVVWEHRADERSLAGAILTPSLLREVATDDVGSYSCSFPDGTGVGLHAGLSGRFARVRDLAPASPNLRESLFATVPAFPADLLFNPTGAAELPTAQVTAYQHVDAAHGHAFDVFTLPSFGLALPLPIDVQHQVRVNDPSGVRNAFYDPGTQASTFFVGAGPGKPNTAYDTVLQHEYFHFVDDRFGAIHAPEPGGHTHAFTEGLADVGALSTSGGDVVGEDFEGPGTVLRDYASPVTVPGGAGTRQLDGKDCRQVDEGGAKVPEPHEHGQALAGFYRDLRADVGAAVADDLVFAAFSLDPPDMNTAVLAMFVRDADPLTGYGGSGDPASAPHYVALCRAAARHGFDCWPRPDLGSEGCWVGTCAAKPPAAHRTTSTEWLGALVTPQAACDPIAKPADEDGVDIAPVLLMGEIAPLTVTVTVDPALMGSGRYGGKTRKGEPNRLHYLYLNAWLIVVGPTGVEDVIHVLGTGSTCSDAGPDGFAPNTVAFDPETWGGASTTATFGIEVPLLPEDRIAILRVRLDYGEDAGELDAAASFWRRNVHGDAALAGPCGPARYGEVEDYQVLLHRE